MGLLDVLVSAQGGQTVDQLGKQFGLSQDQTMGALGNLLPALTKGIGQNMGQSGGLESLMKALQGGDHGRYLDDPSMVSRQDTVEDGNSILGHILGSKDASRKVAAQASEQTGIGSDILKKMLPLVATMAMGALNKKTKEQPDLGGLMGSILGGGQANDSQLGALASLLDSDGDGNVAAEMLGMASKLFKR